MRIEIWFVLASIIIIGACIYSGKTQQKEAMEVWRVVSEIK